MREVSMRRWNLFCAAIAAAVAASVLGLGLAGPEVAGPGAAAGLGLEVVGKYLAREGRRAAAVVRFGWGAGGAVGRGCSV